MLFAREQAMNGALAGLFTVSFMGAHSRAHTPNFMGVQVKYFTSLLDHNQKKADLEFSFCSRSQQLPVLSSHAQKQMRSCD